MEATSADSRATCEELETFLLANSDAAEFDPLLQPRQEPGQRRKKHRFSPDNTYVDVEGLDGEWISDGARVVNASAGGLCVEVFREVDEDTVLLIWFTTEQDERRYALGNVIHRSRKGRGYLLGLQFADAGAF